MADTVDRDDVIHALNGMIRTLSQSLISGTWTAEVERIVRFGEDLGEWMVHRPRRWSMPDQPGPEVTHVRDNAGRIWRQPALGYENDEWQGFWRTVDNELARTWPDLLLGFGPLTDASPEDREETR